MADDNNPPPDWSKDDPITHDRLNDMQRGNLRGITVGPGLRMTRTPNGAVAIALDTKYPVPTPWVFLTGEWQGGGKYKGGLFEFKFSEINATANLLLSDYATAAETDSDFVPSPECLIFNTAETALDTHYLRWSLGTGRDVFPARFIGNNSQGTPIYSITSAPIRSIYGKVASSWTPGSNTVSVTRCDSGGAAFVDYAGTHLPDVDAYLQYPWASSPQWFGAEVGDILGLDFAWTNAAMLYVLKSVTQPPFTNAGDVLTLGSSGATYQPIPPPTGASGSFTSNDTPTKAVVVVNGDITSIT